MCFRYNSQLHYFGDEDTAKKKFIESQFFSLLLLFHFAHSNRKKRAEKFVENYYVLLAAFSHYFLYA